MAIDISGLGYFVPLLAFLLVFVLMYALLKKTEVLGDENRVILLVSFVLAVIFVSAASVRSAVENVIPWFALLIVALFFILVLMAFSQGDVSKMMKPWFGWVFVVILVIVFLISLLNVYYSVICQYLPYQITGVPSYGNPFLEFLYSSRVVGAVLLLIIAAFTAWVITGGKK